MNVTDANKTRQDFFFFYACDPFKKIQLESPIKSVKLFSFSFLEKGLEFLLR